MSATGSSAPNSSSIAWPGLELRHLMALTAVADSGSFSRAAERLGYTQSAVSQQIGTLERIVGAPLFDRPGGPRPVRLTSAGEALLAHARAVLARVQAAAADLRALASGEAGELRVGTLQSVGTRILPKLLRRFRAEWPGIDVTFRESHDCRELLHFVETGDLDLTFTELAVHDHTGFETRALLDDPIVFAAPADTPEAARSVVAVDDIAHLPMIGVRNADCQLIVDDAFRHLPTPPTYVFRSDDNPTIQGCIASGLAYGALPLLTLDENDSGVAIIPIDPDPTRRRLGVAWSADRRPPTALAPFVAAAAAVCDEIDERWKGWRSARLAKDVSARRRRSA